MKVFAEFLVKEADKFGAGAYYMHLYKPLLLNVGNFEIIDIATMTMSNAGKFAITSYGYVAEYRVKAEYRIYCNYQIEEHS